jgi:hypothetical protein
MLASMQVNATCTESQDTYILDQLSKKLLEIQVITAFSSINGEHGFPTDLEYLDSQISIYNAGVTYYNRECK